MKSHKSYLVESHPEIAKQWHPTKNEELKPDNLTSGSDKKVWWLCSEGDSYQAKIFDRTHRNRGCPFCSGKKISNRNKAIIKYPEIFEEWNFIKNKINVEDVSFGSKLKVWWKCKNNHDYEARINHRTTSGSGCPYCNKRSTSLPEIRIFTECLKIFEVLSRYKINNNEIDIYIPKYKIGIEYDGSFWHKDREKFDIEKNKILEKSINMLLRVREDPLNKISSHDLIVKNDKIGKDIDKIFINIYHLLSEEDKHKIDVYLKNADFLNDDIYRKYIGYFPSPFPEKSLENMFPEISSEWHPSKNFPLMPNNFTHGSSKKVWWKCKEGHEWESTINQRTHYKAGCNVCVRSLKFLYPEIAKEWNHIKNKNINLSEINYGSSLKVWWTCNRGHDYQQKINERTGRERGCPFCSGRYLCSTSSLAFVRPDLAKEWHPIKNLPLTASDFTYKTISKVWWQCENGHEWEARISNRSYLNRGCPLCRKN